MSDFTREVEERIEAQGKNQQLQAAAMAFVEASVDPKYSYNFSWMGRPIIQYPQDIVVMQELIWQVKPDLIIETGIAHGGSLVFSASMLSMLDMVEAMERGESMDPAVSRRKVLGIDVDIRAHNREAIEQHPMASRIQMIEGSSVDDEVVNRVKEIAGKYETILVCLDSNHTHEHVLAELHSYAGLTSSGSYCVVFDTLIEDMPDNKYPDRPWGRGDNPKTAVWEFLKENTDFEIDASIHHKLQITVATDGFLRRK